MHSKFSFLSFINVYWMMKPGSQCALPSDVKNKLPAAKLSLNTGPTLIIKCQIQENILDHLLYVLENR